MLPFFWYYVDYRIELLIRGFFLGYNFFSHQLPRQPYMPPPAGDTPTLILIA